MHIEHFAGEADIAQHLLFATELDQAMGIIERESVGAWPRIGLRPVEAVTDTLAPGKNKSGGKYSGD